MCKYWVSLFVLEERELNIHKIKKVPEEDNMNSEENKHLKIYILRKPSWNKRRFEFTN